jgi:O-antigen/teichoic acid export membrane protein
MAVLLAACYPLFIGVLNYLLSGQEVSSALVVLPYALLSLWATVVASVFIGGLDGCQRIDLRSVLMGASHLTYLGLAVLWVPGNGLVGVAQAQAVQAIGLIAFSWWILRHQLVALPLLPIRWRLAVLKEMLGYGVNFQIISLMSMLFDPLTKGLMSKFGGLAALGYYEIASKLILQARAIPVEANRVIVPKVSNLQQREPRLIVDLFVVSYRMLFFASLIFYAVLGIFLPLISYLLIGKYNSTFVHFALLLIFGWSINTVIGPAYFSNLGTGNLRPNVISHVIIGVVGLCAGIVLGIFLDGTGVLVGNVLGLVTGSLFLLISYMKDSGLRWSRELVPKGMWILLTLCVIVVIFANAWGARRSLPELVGIEAAGALGLILVGWYHPFRRNMRFQPKVGDIPSTLPGSGN